MPIIVCSISQSKTSNDVVDIIQQLCPGEEVTFQLAQKRNRFDGRKVVFCHSSLDGRLALTDVNDSVYDKAITDACKIVGKANVTFIVTKVPAADANVRRRMIKETQPTLISNIGMLLLVDKFDVVDHIDQDSINKLKDFLKFAVRPPIYPPIHSPIHDPIHSPSYGFRSQNTFLQIIIISLLMLCLAVVYIQTKQAELLQIEMREQSEVINVLNKSNTGLEKNVHIMRETFKDETRSIGKSLIEYHQKVENKFTQFTDEMAEKNRQMRINIESQLKNIENEQDNLKIQQDNIKRILHGLHNTLDNIKNKPSCTDQQIISVEGKIDDMKSTVIELQTDIYTIEALLQTSLNQSESLEIEECNCSECYTNITLVLFGRVWVN